MELENSYRKLKIKCCYTCANSSFGYEWDIACKLIYREIDTPYSREKEYQDVDIHGICDKYKPKMY